MITEDERFILRAMSEISQLIGYARSAEFLLIDRPKDEVLKKWASGLDDAQVTAAAAVEKLTIKYGTETND